MREGVNLTFHDKEIRNPVLRFGAMLVVVVGGAALIPLLVATVPLHFLLRLCGRRGFVIRRDDGGMSYNVDGDGFRSAA